MQVVRMGVDSDVANVPVTHAALLRLFNQEGARKRHGGRHSHLFDRSQKEKTHTIAFDERTMLLSIEQILGLNLVLFDQKTADITS